jgi:uncharacterized membrane protein
MTTYEFLLFLHILSTIVWIGAGFLIAVLVFGAERAGNRQKASGYHQDVGWLAPRLFIPASFATLIFGILAASEGDWDFGLLWINIAFVGWAISFALGFFYFRPEGQRIGALVAERGPADPEVERRLYRLDLVDRVQLLILISVVADMVIKPTGDDSGPLVVGGLILAAAVLGASVLIRRRATTAPGTPPQPGA